MLPRRSISAAFRPTLGFGALGFLASLPGAVAQEVTAGSSISLPEVSVSGQVRATQRAGETMTPRAPASVAETPQSIDVIPHDITIGGGASYVDSRFGNNTNTVRVPGYVRYDATVAARVTEGVTVRFNALNLTDKRFYEGVYQGSTTPGAGRTLIASTTFRF